MWLTIERKPSNSNCISDPLTEAIDRERLAVLRVDDGYVFALSCGQYREQLAVERDRQLAPSFLLHDTNSPVAYIRPCHAVYIAPALAGIEHQCKRSPLLSANRPMPFEGVNLGISPRPYFLRLRTLNPECRIMIDPSYIDCVPNQDTQHF